MHSVVLINPPLTLEARYGKDMKHFGAVSEPLGLAYIAAYLEFRNILDHPYGDIWSQPNLGMPHTRAMGDGLFEIRAKADVGTGRAFYCTLVGRRIVILHGFIEKTDKTPQRELDVARDRLKEVLQHG